MIRRASVVGIAALAVVLGGCTEIPSSSKPAVIGSQPQSANPTPNPPTCDLAPYQVVQRFVDANAASDATHFDARQYLTSSADTRWTDTRVTVVNEVRVSTTHHTDLVDVHASVLGTVDAAGSYTPELLGNGGGNPKTFRFQTKKIRVPDCPKRQWRIDKLQPGLLVDANGFGQFQQRTIYFFDDTEKELVPVPRYTQLLEPDALADWLVTDLAEPPPDELVSEVPGQTDPARLGVTVPADPSAPVQVDMPGASQLDRKTAQQNLAIQVAATLAQVAGIGTTRQLMILDGTAPVSIYGIGKRFTAEDFRTRIESVATVPQLYYVDPGGGIVDNAGQPLPGRVGSGYYDFTTVDLASEQSGAGFLVAGTRLVHRAETLDVGRENSALKPVPKLSGDLSRPDWAPDGSEVWIGAGNKLYKVSRTGRATSVPLAAAANGQVAGRIDAVRLSPEGSRVALVIKGADAAQIWVGVVARAGAGVQVVDLTAITPAGVDITDVAWNDALKLFAIGHDRAKPQTPGIYEVQCDGSRWSARGTGELPGEPDALTVGAGQVAVVSAADAIWEQNAGSWQSLEGEQTDGNAPIYVD